MRFTYEDILIGLRFNGKPISYCLSADDVEGWVEVIIFENGEAVRDDDGNLVTQKIYGKVQFYNLNPTTGEMSEINN